MEDQNDRLVFETKFWEVFLMEKQLYLGRCVVVLKRDCGDLADITEDEVLDFLSLVKKLESLIRKTFNATMFNWGCLMNNAYQVSPAKPQVHWHFRPRYQDSVELNGQIFQDPNFGHHYLREDNEIIVSNEVFKIILNKLRENL